MRSDISIAISGWRPGFSKVSATHLLSGICGYRLSDAKRTIDEILEGRKVTISLPLAVRPNIIVHQLRNLGLEARLDAMPVFLEVKPDPGRGWLVTSNDQKAVNESFITKDEATRMARQIVRDHPKGRLKIFGMDHKLQSEHSYG